MSPKPQILIGISVKARLWIEAPLDRHIRLTENPTQDPSQLQEVGVRRMLRNTRL